MSGMATLTAEMSRMTISCATQSSRSSCLRRRIAPPAPWAASGSVVVAGRCVGVDRRDGAVIGVMGGVHVLTLAVSGTATSGQRPEICRDRVDVGAGGHGISTSATGTAIVRAAT